MYERKKNQITNLVNGKVEKYESINAAKRASVKLQTDGLGRGQVVVVR